MSKPSFVDRLREGTRQWEKMAETPLKHRNAMLSQWASGYFDPAAKNAEGHVINLVDRAVTILLPYLAMSNPRISVDTRHLSLRHQAYTTELALNNLLEEIKFADNTIRPAVLNSLFGWGVVKTGIMKSHEVEIFGYNHDVGQTYSDIVDDEDFIGDPSARTLEEMGFQGNKYLLRTEVAKEFFDKKHADFILPGYRLLGDTSPNKITKEEPIGYLREYTQFVDYWLPDEDIIITTLADGDYKKILRTVEYDGPEGSPYDILAYKWFPKHPLPIPPGWNWLEMDVLINQIVNKMKLQASRQKNILAYESRAAADIENLVHAKDGSTQKVDNLDAIKDIPMGGVNQDLYTWIAYMDNQFSTQSSNLYTIGGSSSQADTLGQEQMLFGNASKGLDDMTNTVYNFVRSLVQKHAFYMWNNPLENRAVVKDIDGYGPVQGSFNAADKAGDFTKYSLNVIPYSMQRLNPESQFQKMLGFMSQWILPTAQMAAAQGSEIDVAAATKELARKFSLDNIDQWYRSSEPQNVGMNPYQPAVGTKNPGQQDGRVGLQGAASRNANLQQQQTESKKE